jgi:hypothetical protein
VHTWSSVEFLPYHEMASIGRRRQLKHRGAALDDAATSILASPQWGGDLVLSVGAWWPPGGATAFYHITYRTPAAVRGVPAVRSA